MGYKHYVYFVFLFMMLSLSVNAQLYSPADQRYITTGETASYQYVQVHKADGVDEYLAFDKNNHGRILIGKNEGNGLNMIGTMWMVPAFQHPVNFNWYLCPIRNMATEDYANTLQGNGVGWNVGFSDASMTCYQYTNPSNTVSIDATTDIIMMTDASARTKFNVTFTTFSGTPADTGFGFLFVPEDPQQFRYAVLNGENVDLQQADGTVSIDKVFQFLDSNQNQIGHLFDWTDMLDWGQRFSDIITVNGQKGLLVGTYGYGASSTINIDPLYQVDYSPNPAVQLVDGDIDTGADSSFAEEYDITANMSDADSDTYTIIKPQSLDVDINFTGEDTETSVSSTTYTTKISRSYTEPTGQYKLITITGEVRSPNDRPVKVRYLINGFEYGETILYPRNTGDIVLAAFHKIIYMNPDTYTIQLQFANQQDAQPVYMRRARISIAGIYEHYHEEEIGEQTLTATYGDKINLQFTPQQEGTYTILGSGQITSKDGNKRTEARLLVDGTQFHEFRLRPTDNSPLKDYKNFIWSKVVYLTKTEHNISVQARRPDGLGGGIKGLALSAVYTGDLDEKYFNASVAQTNTTSGSYVDKVVLKFTPVNTEKWQFYVTGDIGSHTKNVPIYTRMTIDGLTQCEQVQRFDLEAPNYPWTDMVCQERITLTGGVEHTVKVQYRSGTPGQKVYMKNTNILALKAHNDGTPAKVISARFSNTYDAGYTWFLRLYKRTEDEIFFQIRGYDDNDNVSTVHQNITLTGTGYFEVPVDNIMNYETNTASLNHSRFRISSNSQAQISEVYLRQLANDTIAPNITGCAIVPSNATCLDEMEFHCENITDDVEIDEVYYLINGMNYTATREHGHYAVYFNPEYNGTLNYNFSRAYAYDTSGNLATEYLNVLGQYTCDFQDYINITHNATVGVDITNVTPNSVRIHWMTENLADSHVFWGTSPASLVNEDFDNALTTDHEIQIDELSNSTTYYYNIFSSRNPNQTIGTFNFTTASGCVENWQQDAINCRINDTYIITYTDTNACGTTDDLPANNGTEDLCNYCSEDLEQQVGACTINDEQNVTYVDNNYTSCCVVTGLDSDCSVDTLYPYNTTTTQFCHFHAAELGTPQCQSQFDFAVDEKEYCIVNIPLNYSNETFKCVNYIEKTDGEIVQTNPQYRERAETFLDFWRGEPESRQYFEPANSIVNFYITKKNLQPEEDYFLHVECCSDQRCLSSVHPFSIGYENFEFVFFRTRWLTANAFYIIGGLLIGFVILSVLLWLYRGAIR